MLVSKKIHSVTLRIAFYFVIYLFLNVVNPIPLILISLPILTCSRFKFKSESFVDVISLVLSRFILRPTLADRFFWSCSVWFKFWYVLSFTLPLQMSSNININNFGERKSPCLTPLFNSYLGKMVELWLWLCAPSPTFARLSTLWFSFTCSLQNPWMEKPSLTRVSKIV